MSNAAFFNRTASTFGNEYFATNTADDNIDSGLIQLAGGFKPTQSKTVDKVEILVRGGGGTPPTYTVELQTDTAGSPSGVAISSGTFTPTTASNTEYEVEMSDVAISAGTNYWIVVKAASATAINYATFRRLDDPGGCFTGQGMYTQISTNTGTTWGANGASNLMTVGVKYTDTSYEGFGFSDFDTIDINDASDRFGEYFPGSGQLVTTISMFIKKSDAGTPSADLSIVLRNYDSSTDIETGTLVTSAAVTTSMVKYTYTFSTTRTLTNGVNWLIYLSTAAGSGTRFRILPPKTFNTTNMNQLTYNGTASARSNLTTQDADKDSYFLFTTIAGVHQLAALGAGS